MLSSTLDMSSKHDILSWGVCPLGGRSPWITTCAACARPAAQLGAALGVSRQSVNSIEKGKYDPSLPLAIAIARYFETTVEEIFHV